MNEQQLAAHIRDTPAYIEQHRARITMKKQRYSDMPNEPPSFGPKSPCNDGAIMLADQEAATVGRLASYCQNKGTIPHLPMRGFWWVKGRCLGLRSGDDLSDFREVVRVLEGYAPEIVATEGVEPYLQDMSEIRHVSATMFPNEREDWLSLERAVEFTGRKPETIMKWVNAGSVPVLDRQWGVAISKQGLNMKLAIAYANRLRGAQMSREKRSLNVA